MANPTTAALLQMASYGADVMAASQRVRAPAPTAHLTVTRTFPENAPGTKRRKRRSSLATGGIERVERVKEPKRKKNSLLLSE